MTWFPQSPKISLARGPVAGWAGMTLSRSPQYRTMLPQRETHLSSPLAAVVGGDRGEVWVSREQQHCTIAPLTRTRHFLGHFPASMCQRTYRRLTITYRSPLQETILYTKYTSSLIVTWIINKVDTTNRCEALKEVYVFEMFNIKTFLYQTPPYQRAQIFQIFWNISYMMYLKHLIYLILNLVEVHTVTPTNQDAMHLKMIMK